MSIRSSFSSPARLLQALAIAAAGFSVAFAQPVPGPQAAPAATEKTPAGELSAQMDAELWSAIKDGDRAKVFEEYLRQYPDGRNSAQAAGRLADLRKADRSPAAAAPPAASGPVPGNDSETALWKVVFQSDTSGSYEVFLKYYPKGRYARLAASRLKLAQENARWKAESVEQGAWQTAESTGTADGYAAYLASYPQGRFAALALAQRDRLGAGAAVAEESRLWQAAEKGGIAQVNAYQTGFPQGAHAAAASSRLARLKKEEADMIPGKTVKDCPDCPAMVVIPAGSFRMGEDDAKPVHTVTIERHFAMAKTEVTQQQWRAVMGTNPSRLDRCDDCPVEGISWNDAKLYVDKLSRMTGKIYRLPSEAEWEYACRAGGRQEYCGSDTADNVAWHGALVGSGNSGGRTHPAGQKQANVFGLHDMSGNVSEWVEDCYHARYAGGPNDGSARITSEGGRTAVQVTEVNAKTKGKDAAAKLKGKDPAAKAAAEEASAREREECKGRVVRGGSWLSSPQHARATHRLSIAPNSSSSSYGFRPVWSLR